jgi:hypothetical protein
MKDYSFPSIIAFAILSTMSFCKTVGRIESTVRFFTHEASVCAAIIACLSVIWLRRASRAPLNIPGKTRTLFTWFG